MSQPDQDQQSSDDSQERERIWELIKKRLSGSRGHASASATLAFGYIAQLGFQTGYFLILTRLLGVDTFGRFAAALAAINLISPLAGIGYGEVALVRVSEETRNGGLWAIHATLVTVIMGTVVTIGLALASMVIPEERWLSWPVILGLSLSELVLVRGCHVISRVHQACGRVGRTSVINVSVSAIKFSVALTLLLAGRSSIGSLVLALDVLIAAAFAGFVVQCLRETGTTAIRIRLLVENFGLALSFAAGVVSKAVYTDLDKLFLAKWTNSVVVGTYAAGYKIISLSFMPMRAILEATFPRQVQLAKRDASGCKRFTYSVMLVNIGLGACIALALFVTAPLLVYVLGDEFADSVDVLRWGFLLPVFQAVHYTLGNHLTAIGQQHARMALQVILLVIYVVAGIIVIPIYSWKGAIGTSLGCEFLLGMMFMIACQVLPNRQMEATH